MLSSLPVFFKIVIAVFCIFPAVGLAKGAKFSDVGRLPIERQLRTPFRAVFSDLSLREALDSLRNVGGVSYWLDRRVDPSLRVNVEITGSTLEEGFHLVSASLGLVSLPIDRLVIVGRREWVERTGTLIMMSQSLATASPRPQTEREQTRSPADRSPVAIAWPRLTTPSEALQAVATRIGASMPKVDLEHDLWPAFRMDKVSPLTLLVLIGSEFDIWLRSHSGQIVLQKIPVNLSLTKSYPERIFAQPLLQQVRQLDPSSRWRRRKGRLQVRAHAVAHRVLARATQEKPGRRQRSRAPAVQPNQQEKTKNKGLETFSLNVKNKKAVAILRLLAQAGEWELRIDPAAINACNRLVSLTKQEATLRQHIQRLVQQIKLSASWEGKQLHISLENE